MEDEAGSSSGGRNLFDGLKFWLARRVYNRSDLILLIESNGGSVVPREQDADMLIADPLRKDAPAGSYSFELILHSVEQGILQIADKYFLGPDPDLPRSKATGRSTHSRIEFSKADDAALAAWVLKNPQGRRGNAIWQEFAASHHNHTWQSWRNRYSKRYINFTQEQLEALAASVGPAANNLQGLAAPRSSAPSPSHRGNSMEAAQKGEARARQNASPKRAQASVPEHQRIPSPTTHQRPQEKPQEKPREKPREKPKEMPMEKSLVPDEPEVMDADVQGVDDERMVAEVASDPEEITEKESFYNDLQLYADAKQLDIEREYIISGQVFEIWDLYEAVTTQEVPLEKVDWTRVARDLGYEQRQQQQVAPKVQRYFQKNLEEFCRELDNFDEENESEDGDAPAHGQMEQDQRSEGSAFVFSNGRSSPILSFAPFPPPSKAVTPSKRRPDAQAQSSKRRRLERITEIPATPEEALRPTSSARRTRESMSPTRRGMAQNTSPTRTQATSPGKAVEQTPEQHSSLLRQARRGKRPEWLSTDDPFASPSEPPSTTRSSQRPQRPEMQEERSRPAINAADEVVIPSSPSTLRGWPKATPRVLPPSFSQASIAPRRPPAAARPQSNSNTQPLPTAQSRQATERAAVVRPPISEPGLKESRIEHYKSQGFSSLQIREAMLRTSMVPHAADRVLQSFRKGLGVPEDVQGIWTEADDKQLRFVHKYRVKEGTAAGDLPQEAQLYDERAREMHERLVRKHGRESIEARRRFLKEAALLRKKGG